MSTLVNTLIASFFPVLFVPQDEELFINDSGPKTEVTVCEDQGKMAYSEIYIFL